MEGNGIPILKASQLSGMPIREIRELARLGVVFCTGDMVSASIVPFLKSKAEERKATR